MKILVIGGTSFIGPAVVRQLADAGHDLTVFNRGQTQTELPESVARITGDRERIGTFREQLRELSPDVVLDMRPLSERDARLVVDAVSGVADRIVAISSADVYRAYDRMRGSDPGPPDPTPLTEDSPLREHLYPYRADPPRPDDDPEKWMDKYDKIPVERVVMGNADLPGTILRLPMVYGPRDRQHRFREFVKRMDDGRSAIVLNEGYARWRSSWGYVDNVAAAIALAVIDGRAAGRIYNVAESGHPTTAGLVQELAAITGWSGRIVTVPDSARPSRLNAEQQFVMDGTRIRRELGYREIVPREEAMRRTVAWERKGPPPPDPADFDYAAEDELLEQSGRSEAS